jgi:hypothetical protein
MFYIGHKTASIDNVVRDATQIWDENGSSKTGLRRLLLLHRAAEHV